MHERWEPSSQQPTSTSLTGQDATIQLTPCQAKDRTAGPGRGQDRARRARRQRVAVEHRLWIRGGHRGTTPAATRSTGTGSDLRPPALGKLADYRSTRHREGAALDNICSSTNRCWPPPDDPRVGAPLGALRDQLAERRACSATHRYPRSVSRGAPASAAAGPCPPGSSRSSGGAASRLTSARPSGETRCHDAARCLGIQIGEQPVGFGVPSATGRSRCRRSSASSCASDQRQKPQSAS